MESTKEDAVNLLIYFFLTYQVTNFSIFYSCSMINKANYSPIIILPRKRTQMTSNSILWQHIISEPNRNVASWNGTGRELVLMLWLHVKLNDFKITSTFIDICQK